MARTQILNLTCRCCGKVYQLEVDPFDVQDYIQGKQAQNAFPYLNAGERELIISRTCPTCWDKLWEDMEN